MTTTVPNRFAEGELVDVALSGLRYADTRSGHMVLVGDAGRGDGEPYELVVPVSARMKVTRVAPREWPPVPGDVWATASGVRWFARASQSEDVDECWVVPALGAPTVGYYSQRLLELEGPLTLMSRDGWTREAEPEPAEVDERAAYVEKLRRLADFVESRTDLPVPNSSVAVQYSVLGYSEGEPARLAEVARVAGLLGVEVRSDGTTADLAVAPDATYVVHTFRDRKPAAVSEPAPSDVDATLTEDRHHADPNTGEPCTMPGCQRADCVGTPFDEMPDVPPEFTAEQVAAEVPAGVQQLAAQVGRVLDEPTSALPIVPAGTEYAGDDEGDGRCSGFLLEYVAATNETSHEHKCELYGDDHGGNHICLCGTEWENAPAGVQS